MPHAYPGQTCSVVALMVTALLVFDNSLYVQPAAAQKATVDATPMATPRPLPDGRFHVQLKDGSLIVARLAKNEPLKMKCLVGSVEIPLKEIGALHFAADGKCKVMFRNNDLLSGELLAESLLLETSFGEARIGLANVVAMVSHEHSVQSGNVMQRVIQNTEDGEKFDWRTITPPQPTGYPSSPYGGYSSPPPPVQPTVQIRG